MSRDEIGKNIIFIAAGEFRGRSLSLFVRYVMARFEQERDLLAYKVYVSDTLRFISLNTAANPYAKKPVAAGERFFERWQKMRKPPEPQKSAEEIISNLTEKTGLVVI